MRRPRLAHGRARALPALVWLAVTLVNVSTGGSIHPVWLVASLLVVVGAELTMAGRAHVPHRPHPHRPPAHGPLDALAVEVERRTTERGADDPETIAVQRALDEARHLARDAAGAAPRSDVSRRAEDRGSAPAAPP